MSLFFVKAFTDEDPFWACHYGITTHKLYRQCARCPSADKCDIKSMPLLPQECSYKCVECGEINTCAQIRKQLAAQIELERGGKKFRRWRRFCLSKYKHVCLGCAQSLYCPKLAKKMNRTLPPMPSLIQCLREIFLNR